MTCHIKRFWNTMSTINCYLCKSWHYFLANMSHMQKIYENDYFIGRQKCRMDIKDNLRLFRAIGKYLFVW